MSDFCGHLILRFLIDKYVDGKGKKVFACFLDLQKEYDTVPRNKLFYTLLKNYSVGGKVLRIVREIYKNNQVFVKLTGGLLKPFKTSIGVKPNFLPNPVQFFMKLVTP